ncbi:MAG: hypothetical protein RLZZ543_1409 [Bacteroidota bacterium]|jgi:anhydro-N-acetylmuramic acid kinase
MEVLSYVQTGIGIMSGTSVDGLDLIAVSFHTIESEIGYTIHEACTIPYSTQWRNRLLQATELNALEMRQLDVDFAEYMAQHVNQFQHEKSWNAQFIASHGHTIFHQPEKKLTLQIGCGATLAAHTGITTVCDFRQGDVALHGQGAPLVPIGDQLLFKEFTYCLNLGGFANVSYQEEGQRIAYDICALNVVLNAFARRLGAEFDFDGEVAASGKIIPELVDQLNALPYYHKKAPKSLGTEWVDEFVSPIITQYSAHASIPDLLHSFGVHFAIQIGKALNKEGKTLVTGGGAKNGWLMKQIKLHSTSTVELTDGHLIDSKEALIFALLGYLRMNEVSNTLPSVTGAIRPISAGAVYKG